MDFSKYQSAKSHAEKRKTADEVVNAFKEVGFVYLSNHGISDATVRNAFQRVSNTPWSSISNKNPTELC